MCSRGIMLRYALPNPLAPVSYGLMLILVAAGCDKDPQAPDPTPESTAPALAAISTTFLSFRQVSAGAGHTCGVTTDDRAYCWGLNDRGQLGDGTSGGQRERPVLVRGGLRFRQVSAGSFHTCGLTVDYRAYCWGSNRGAALGDGTTRLLARTPVPVASDRRFHQVSAGDSHTCAVSRSDRAFCWGSNHTGQLGDGTTAGRRAPRLVAGGLSFRMVAAGSAHTCGVTLNSHAYCWGSNEHGAVGDGTTTPLLRLAPVAVAGGRLYSQVTAGERHSCGVTTNGRAFCWGWNLYGQLGDGTETDRRAPRAVSGGLAYSGVSAGGAHTCGVRTDQGISCWGHNSLGQLGNGTTDDRSIPGPVYGDFQFREVDTGMSHSCGVTVANRAYCWGYGGWGQRGDGTTHAIHPWPSPVLGPS